MADTTRTLTAEQTAPTEAKTEFIEYLGEPTEKHGVDFLHSHSIPKGDPVWARLGVDRPNKDLTWERDPLGKPIGFKGNRLLLSTEGLDPALVTALTEKVPGFKLVSE